MNGGAAPAQRGDAEEDLPAALGGAIARGGEIGNEPGVPERQRHREIGQDRPDVPFQRAAKLRPHPHRRRIGKHPVEIPGTAEMQHRIDAGADHREQRHGLGKPIERIAPFASSQQQQRRDQRAGVADAEPPDVIVDRESPVDGNVDAPDADAAGEQLDDGNHQQQQKRGGEDHRDQPAPLDRKMQGNAGELIGDAADALIGRQDIGGSIGHP